MNYGERQERAIYLVKLLRQNGEKMFSVSTGTATGNEIAQAIEDETDDGKSFVAIAGIVLQALKNDPSILKYNLDDRQNDD